MSPTPNLDFHSHRWLDNDLETDRPAWKEVRGLSVIVRAVGAVIAVCSRDAITGSSPQLKLNSSPSASYTKTVIVVLSPAPIARSAISIPPIMMGALSIETHPSGSCSSLRLLQLLSMLSQYSIADGLMLSSLSLQSLSSPEKPSPSSSDNDEPSISPSQSLSLRSGSPSPDRCFRRNHCSHPLLLRRNPVIVGADGSSSIPPSQSLSFPSGSSAA